MGVSLPDIGREATDYVWLMYVGHTREGKWVFIECDPRTLNV